MREQMKKLKSGPSTSEYSSFHGKYIIDVVCHTTVQRYCHVVPLVGLTCIPLFNPKVTMYLKSFKR